jgi:hypothetical protein
MRVAQHLQSIDACLDIRHCYVTGRYVDCIQIEAPRRNAWYVVVCIHIVVQQSYHHHTLHLSLAIAWHVVDHKIALPYLAWRSAFGSQVSTLPGQAAPRVRDPLLAIAYGKHISIFQAVPSSARERRGVELIRASHYTTDVTLAGVHWLGSQVLVLLNVKDQLRVLDPFTLTELENLDVTVCNGVECLIVLPEPH